MRKPVRCFALLLALAGCTSPTDASDVTDSTPDASAAGICAVGGTLVTYLHLVTTDLTDTRCTPATDPGVTTCTIDLRGYLYVPKGNGNFPAIVWNHGSEQSGGTKCSIANYFVPQGYVVFVPHRRGHGKSTGVYVGDYPGPQIDYLQMQVADVTAAWSYLIGLSANGGVPLVDRHRMAIAGHSYGGIMTLLTNATSLEQKVALDFCGDSESWGNSSFKTALMTAVDDAKSPIFFAQPQNDVHIEPTVEFGHEAGLDGQLHQATIYPPVPNVSTAEEAHSRFVTDPAQVAIWGPGALDFLHRFGM